MGFRRAMIVVWIFFSGVFSDPGFMRGTDEIFDSRSRF